MVAIRIVLPRPSIPFLYLMTGMSLLLFLSNASGQVISGRDIITPKEDRITGEWNQATRTLKVEIPFEIESKGDIFVRVEAFVVDIKGKSYGNSSSADTFSSSPSSIKVEIPLSTVSRLEDLLTLNLKYNFMVKSRIITGYIALFRILPLMRVKVLIPSILYSNSNNDLFVRIWSEGLKEPIENVKVEIKLKKGGKIIKVFEGRSNRDGFVLASFPTPQEISGESLLFISVKKGEESKKLYFPVFVSHDVLPLIGLSQPRITRGGAIEVSNTLFKLSNPGIIRNTPTTVEIFDSKYRSLFYSSKRTNKFGSSTYTFSLPSDFPLGTCTVITKVGGGEIEEIERVKITGEKGEEFEMHLQPDYHSIPKNRKFMGSVVLKLKGTDGRPDGILELSLLLHSDKGLRILERREVRVKGEGAIPFSFDLDEDLARSECGKTLLLQSDFTGMVDLNPSIKIREREVLPIPLSPAIINVRGWVSGGGVIPHIPNRFYFVSFNEEGKPESTTIRGKYSFTSSYGLKGQSGEFIVKTDKYGIGDWKIEPEGEVYMELQYEDRNGKVHYSTLKFPLKKGGEGVSLELDKLRVRRGEEVGVGIYSSKLRGKGYLLMVQNGIITDVTEIPLKRAGWRGKIRVPDEAEFQVQLQLIGVGDKGLLLSDSKILLIEGPAAISGRVSPLEISDNSSPIFRCTVNDRNGKPVSSIVKLLRKTSKDTRTTLSLTDRMLKEWLERRIISYFLMKNEFDYNLFKYLTDIPIDKLHEINNSLCSGGYLEGDSLKDFMSNMSSLSWTEGKATFLESARRIEDGINSFSRNFGRFPNVQDGFRELIRNQYLTIKDILDPWGEPFLISPISKNLLFPFKLVSKGPDEVEETEDDISIGIFPVEGAMVGEREAIYGTEYKLPYPLPFSTLSLLLWKQKEKSERYFPIIDTPISGEGRLYIPAAEFEEQKERKEISGLIFKENGDDMAPFDVDFGGGGGINIISTQPESLHINDRVSLPIRIENRSHKDIFYTLLITTKGGVKSLSPPIMEGDIRGNETASFSIEVEGVEVGDGKVETSLTFSNKGDKRGTEPFQSSRTYYLRVVGDPVVNSFQRSLSLKTPTPFSILPKKGEFSSLNIHLFESPAQMLPFIIDQSLTYPEMGKDILSKMVSALFSVMLFKERGFEKESLITLYKTLRESYQSILVRETKNGGFAEDGDEGDPLLSALAQVTLSQIKELLPVDSRVIRRNRDFLLSSFNPSYGFTRAGEDINTSLGRLAQSQRSLLAFYLISQDSPDDWKRFANSPFLSNTCKEKYSAFNIALCMGIEDTIGSGKENIKRLQKNMVPFIQRVGDEAYLREGNVLPFSIKGEEASLLTTAIYYRHLKSDSFRFLNHLLSYIDSIWHLENPFTRLMLLLTLQKKDTKRRGNRLMINDRVIPSASLQGGEGFPLLDHFEGKPIFIKGEGDGLWYLRGTNDCGQTNERVYGVTLNVTRPELGVKGQTLHESWSIKNTSPERLGTIRGVYHLLSGATLEGVTIRVNGVKVDGDLVLSKDSVRFSLRGLNRGDEAIVDFFYKPGFAGSFTYPCGHLSIARPQESPALLFSGKGLIRISEG